MANRDAKPKRKIAGRTSTDYRIGIAYDGELTEDAYFRSWQQLLSQGALSIFPNYVKSGGNPLVAVQAAIAIHAAHTDYAEFWCVCDVDGANAHTINSAKQLAASKGIRLALSDRCFEVWLALHFKTVTVPIATEAEAIALITPHQANYGTPRKLPDFKLFFPNTLTALANADWLSQQGLVNPSTNVHSLVKKLLSNVI